ncbi:PREDICTED: TMV resistance [Prunus dulcis]|uniref:PREDICTED: TMV resistance n=1 Tax=Prunus dulcis TaxID=3755 RepID=A0A5E4GMX2_PRUDU|nr:PREDICTED: TMV resistance [Prunus dulcis]
MFSLKSLFRLMGSSPLPIDSGVEPQLPSDLPPTTTQPVSSSPSSSSFAPDSSWTYDVFLSFRGEDTRTNFTDHLYKALCDKGIYTFIDRELVRGEEIPPALVKAIEESRISVIVFSENYASSRWCLDELVKILQCKQSKQQVVLPIFYKVDPSHVRNQESKFGDAFEELIKRKFKNDKEKVLIWREALRQAANLSGHTFKDEKYEATFINDIVKGIVKGILSVQSWHVAAHPVGIESRVEDVERLLDVGGNGRRMVGIWGTSGIGKTTIAKAIWNAIAYEFEGRCFLENVREGSLIQLQQTLLDKILGKNWKIQSVDEGIGVIKKRLRHKKILLILDDVDHLEQLEKLAGDDWFGEGSRVIITTKNRRLLDNRKIEFYEVKKLEYYNQALELFSWHAFRRSEPPEDYLELAQRAIAIADGLPLALTILGAHLRGIDIPSWQVILDDYEGEPYTHIERILQKSYDALDHRAKGYFLDIACFFKGRLKDYVLQIVPPKVIEEFVDKALITIEGGDILMHDLLANLGKEIVHKESPDDPGQRSRLWFYEDVIQVLTDCTGTRNIKGIMVKLPEPAEITLNPECFRKMVNLQIFISHNASLCGHINYLPNALRIIDCPSCQLQSLPPNFQGNRLVEFKMPGSHIRQLERFKYSPNLTCMNLRGCQFLEKIPDLSGIPNIKYLFLSDCTSLVELDDSVGFLDKLVVLDLAGCVKLMRFATTLRLPNLIDMNLRGCQFLEKIPDLSGIPNIEYLFISDCTSLVELDDSVGFLDKLVVLDLEGCVKLMRFATTLRLPNLIDMNLRGCQFLEKIPDLSGIPNIEYLFISDCTSLVELDDSVGFLDKLVDLDLEGCVKLMRFATTLRLPNLTCMNLRGCQFLEKIPDLSGIPNIKYLFLSDCTSLVELDDSVGFLDKLVDLDLEGCVKLMRFATTLRLPNLTRMNLRGCQFLEKIPDLSGIPNIKYLFLSDCTSLVELDDSVGFLDKLVDLDLMGCVKLMRFATTLRLPNLTYMNLRGCQSLEKIPDLSGIPNIKYLFRSECTSLAELDDSIGFLDGCVNLTKFGRRFRLKSLETLDLKGCASLESFPEIEVKMESLRRLTTKLRSLNLSGANFVTLPECISKFVSLKYLTLRDCKSLREIPQEVLPPRVCWVSLDNCTSLEKFPKLPLSSEVKYVSLMNCVSLRGYDIAENSILDQVSVSSLSVSLFVSPSMLYG